MATINGCFCLSWREVVELGEAVLEAPLSVGNVDALGQAISAALAAPVAQAAATLPPVPVVNAAETPWKARKARPWRWVAVTAPVTVLRMATTRSSPVIKDLLGADYGDTLGSGRSAAYAWLNVAHRLMCRAHAQHLVHLRELDGAHAALPPDVDDRASFRRVVDARDGRFRSDGVDVIGFDL